MAADTVVKLTNDNFEEEVLQAEVPVLVDFWAEWCGPCKMIAPLIDQLADQYEGRVKVAKLDTEEARDVAIQYQISAIPTLMVFKDGQVVSRMTGARGSAQAMAEELRLEEFAA